MCLHATLAQCCALHARSAGWQIRHVSQSAHTLNAVSCGVAFFPPFLVADHLLPPHNLQLHNTHLPNEAPQRFIDLYNSSDTFKNTFYGMVSVVDETVANVTAALKVRDAGPSQDASTNAPWRADCVSALPPPLPPTRFSAPACGTTRSSFGRRTTARPRREGPTLPSVAVRHCRKGRGDTQHACGNCVLRAPMPLCLSTGKGSNWEGGTRVPAFVTGGVLPSSMRGMTVPGPFHIADWCGVCMPQSPLCMAS